MSRTSNATLTPVQELTAKLYDADSDIRYMSLSDLQEQFIHPVHGGIVSADYNVCAKLVDGFLHTLNDPNGEVQNQTIKCIGPFVHKMHPTILCPMIHKFTDLERVDSVDLSISALAVRAIVISLPRPTAGVTRSKAVNEAYSAISKVLIPRLVGYIVIPHNDRTRPDPPKGLLEEDLEKGRDSNSIDVLTEVARCFGPMLQADEVKALQNITLQFLENDRTGSVMKKKAVVALSALSHYFSDEMLSSMISHIIESLRNPHLTPANRKLYITILGSMARAIPTKFGPHLRTLAPFVLSAVSQLELDEQLQAAEEEEEERDPQADEVREAALVTIEAFLASCGSDMERYLDDSVDAALRFIKYDPIVANADDEDLDGADDEEDIAEDDFELDEDFEEEGAADDEDDVSWKVRRCAAKTLHTIISVRTRDILDNATNYDRIALALVARFKEREESVRLEVLSTTAFLIRKTGEGENQVDVQLSNGVEHALVIQPQSRKRRRGYSDVSMTDIRKSGRFTGSTSPERISTPSAGSVASLAKVGPQIVEGLLKLLKTSTIPSKHASVSLLRDYVIARHGGFDNVMDTLLESLIGAIKTSRSDTHGISSTTMSFASGSSLQIESLRLLAEILKTHSSKAFQSQLAKMIAAVIQATHDKSPKVSCDALSTLEQLVKALTPPRSMSTTQKTSSQLEHILGVILEIISARNVDLSVRQQAIHALGTLLGRTLGPQGVKLLSQPSRAEAFEILFETSKNETTRYASIKAINAIGAQATDNKQGYDSVWLSKVCLELGAQLRKADRSLRGASLETLRTFISERGASRFLDASSSQQLTALLVPLLVSNDLHLLGPAVVILAAMVKDNGTVSDDLTKHICELLLSSSATSVLDQLCILARSLGERGAGTPLMQALLKDVGVNGSPPVVGKVIGTLLISGQGKVGVTLQDFLNELQNAPDDRRRCLALAVLGEVGLRIGSATSELSPDLFMLYFGIKSDEVPLAAAGALGRAAAGHGNVKSWVPAILSRIKQNPGEQYLVLHSIRELLQHNENDQDIVPFTGSLWDSAISASRTEDNRTIGAECVANLVMIDPAKFLTVLQSLLSNEAVTVRGTAILAFRDVFTLTDVSYDKDLRPIMIDVVTTMMRDSEVENRRSSLNTFNAAARNKPTLILPHLYSLMPLVVDQSIKDPSLIREVKMGPFTHTVDDGLEVRKSAYETLYSLMEIAPTRIDIVKLYDRVVAGVGDDRGIQTLCNLMITKLMLSAPEETVRRLDSIAEQFRAVLNFTPKETAVRPEHEKADEAKRGVIRVSLELNKAFPGEVGPSGRPGWTNYTDYMNEKHGVMVKAVEKDMKEKERA